MTKLLIHYQRIDTIISGGVFGDQIYEKYNHIFGEDLPRNDEISNIISSLTENAGKQYTPVSISAPKKTIPFEGKLSYCNSCKARNPNFGKKHDKKVADKIEKNDPKKTKENTPVKKAKIKVQIVEKPKKKKSKFPSVYTAKGHLNCCILNKMRKKNEGTDAIMQLPTLQIKIPKFTADDSYLAKTIMFIDVESTSCQFTFEDSENNPHRCGARIIQIGYQVYNAKKLELESSVYVKQPGILIKEESIHGITEEILEAEGIDQPDALNKLIEDLKKCDAIVAHNAITDIKKILSALYENKMYEHAKILKDKDIICTLNMYKSISKEKSGALLNIYNLLHKTNEQEQHEALFDAKICSQIFYTMTKQLLSSSI